jgi:hypothetical protein
MTKLVRFVIPVVIAVVLGPLVAGVGICLLAVGTNTLDHAVSLPIADLLSMLGVCIVIAYLSGGVVALAAGILVSMWMLWRPPNAIVIIAAAAIATAGYLGVGALGFLSFAEYIDVRSNFLFALLLAVTAAASCWLLTGRFVRAL